VTGLDPRDPAVSVERLYCTCGGIGCDTCKPEMFIGYSSFTNYDGSPAVDGDDS